ncbi:MAG: hypothetical protein KAS32_28580 [Candidatus Peribacteraceae bacterium]|nr:hypothetical protein [Candidatus Peribacteraceae bacterium]
MYWLLHSTLRDGDSMNVGSPIAMLSKGEHFNADRMDVTPLILDSVPETFDQRIRLIEIDLHDDRFISDGWEW